MSETANTLIKAALRSIKVIASGETPTNDDMQDGLEALRIMLRSASAKTLMIHYIEQETLAMSGAASYTIGSGGDCDTTWPVSVIGGVVDSDYVLTMVANERYRRLARLDSGGTAKYLWYNPEYPLGVLYPWPTGGGSMVIDCVRPLTDPTAITDTVSFPPPYDAYIKWNLAISMSPEYGVTPSQLIFDLARDSRRAVEVLNFSNQINEAQIDLPVGGRGSYRIDEG